MTDNQEQQTRETAISNVETEYLEITSKEAWPILYQHIRNECGNYGYTFNESKKRQNRNLNRYRDVSPYDHTRIVLKRGPCDYINANLIQVDRAHRQYILTQGPLPSTAGHFWLMVWEQNSKAVLMLNKIIEKDHVKCHQYWPLDSTDSIMNFPDVGLKVEYISKTETPDYTTRTLRITDLETLESRDILHFHYITWPDFGVPQSPTAFLHFLADVRQSGVLNQNVGPPVVHCSAGIGRSGTFCLVDTCLVLIEENGLNSVNVRDVLMEMRKSRMGLIQTPDQLRFSYAAIIEGAKQLPSNNVNVDNNEIVTNHYDVVNNINNSSIEEEDEPPPLPPPRGESLQRSMIAELTANTNTANDELGGPPDKPLPREPSTCTQPSTSPPPTNSTSITNKIHEQNSDGAVSSADIVNDSENSFHANSPPSSPDAKSELRQRNLDKKERLAAQVREMKRRQKEVEEWQKLKRSLFKPLTIGIGAAIVGGGVLALVGYLYMRG
ncbi:PREDICTED: tyrosine-protein phosphatase non-receptor type 2 isoform X3 [Polistes canadensis]|uniref:tyrosine-protein phosphatase non-receptor type 2 isoform X3 n=1 Tax=Polistes canadensis TaxID=91411 RepID=UPI000718FD91|nr:PREDICTED: tyrosine-protein phosphatase non-receptor type 2 isoform X3 [Polistes canadensis]